MLLRKSTFNSQPTCLVFQQFHLLFVCHRCRAAFDGLGKSKERASMRHRGTIYPPTQLHALPRGRTLPEMETRAHCHTLSCCGNNLGEIRFSLDLSLSDSLEKVAPHLCSDGVVCPGAGQKGSKIILLCAFHVCWSCVNTLPREFALKKPNACTFLLTLFMTVCEFAHVNSCLLWQLGFSFHLAAGGELDSVSRLAVYLCTNPYCEAGCRVKIQSYAKQIQYIAP